MFVLIFCDFCGFISIAYTTLNKLCAVFLYIMIRYEAFIRPVDPIVSRLVKCSDNDTE